MYQAAFFLLSPDGTERTQLPTLNVAVKNGCCKNNVVREPQV